MLSFARQISNKGHFHKQTQCLQSSWCGFQERRERKGRRWPELAEATWLGASSVNRKARDSDAMRCSIRAVALLWLLAHIRAPWPTQIRDGNLRWGRETTEVTWSCCSRQNSCGAEEGEKCSWRMHNAKQPTLQRNSSLKHNEVVLTYFWYFCSNIKSKKAFFLVVFCDKWWQVIYYCVIHYN